MIDSLAKRIVGWITVLTLIGMLWGGGVVLWKLAVFLDARYAKEINVQLDIKRSDGNTAAQHQSYYDSKAITPEGLTPLEQQYRDFYAEEAEDLRNEVRTLEQKRRE